MAVESIFYSVSGLSCRGALIWDEGAKGVRPLLLTAPNWRGVIKPAIETGQMLAEEGYIVFVADMFGEGNGPVGTEDPMEFLRPFMADVPGMRRRIAAALDTLTREADRRAIGDVSRRAAMGFCFGGLNVLDLARTGAEVQAVVSMHGTLATPAPYVQLENVAAGVMTFNCVAFVGSPREVGGVKSDLLFEILERLRSERLPMTSPQSMLVRTLPPVPEGDDRTG